MTTIEQEKETINRMKNKKSVLLLIAAFTFLTLTIIVGFAFLHPAPAKKFDLQVGQNRDFNQPGVLDNKNRTFKNDKQMFAVVIYPDKDYVSLNKKARIFVTAQNHSIVIQEYLIEEHADLAADEMPLHNENWHAGDYSVYFERDHQIIKQVDFTLSN